MVTAAMLETAARERFELMRRAFEDDSAVLADTPAGWIVAIAITDERGHDIESVIPLARVMEESEIIGLARDGGAIMS